MLNQIITVLVLSLFAGLGGWYFGAHCQRRVDDREKERLVDRHRSEMERAFGAPGDDTEPFPDLNPDILESQKRRVGDVVAANSHCVELISDDLKKISSMLRGSLSDLQEFRDFRARIMESAIRTHGQFDRCLRFARPPGVSIGLLRDLIESLGEIEEQSVRVRSIAAEVNLLATNASLEASRAGESGRAFSVFADCMRRLSDEGTDTIMDIYELVDKTRYDLEQVIGLLERNNETQPGDAADVPDSFSELEKELTRIDQITARSVSSLDLSGQRILDLEHKVHALSDSLANGLAAMFQGRDRWLFDRNPAPESRPEKSRTRPAKPARLGRG